jgi:hypothetical protein
MNPSWLLWQQLVREKLNLKTANFGFWFLAFSKTNKCPKMSLFIGQLLSFGG